MYRWYFIFFVVSIAGLAAIIYIDSRPDDTAEVTNQAPSQRQHHESFEQTSETYFDFHSDIDISSPESVQLRIEEIEQRLSEIDARSRAAIPFYGELVLLYQQLGRQDGAAEASRHIAMIADDAEDWWRAALFNHQWAERLSDQSGRDFYLGRSAEAFEEAIKLSDNPSLYTDYSITLILLGEETRATQILEETISQNPDYFRAFLYAGMIYYESDKKDESIAYIKRSIEKANSEEELEMIYTLIAGTSIEI